MVIQGKSVLRAAPSPPKGLGLGGGSMGIKIGRYDAMGKLLEVIEVDEECIDIDAFNPKKFSIRDNSECAEELWEKVRIGYWEVIEEEEEEEEEERWHRRRRRRKKRERNRRNRRRKRRW
jgi:hypothetical protein